MPKVDHYEALSRRWATEFGARLLAHSADGESCTILQMREVARDLIASDPDGAAVFVAGLVARDILRPTGVPYRAEPSPN